MQWMLIHKNVHAVLLLQSLGVLFVTSVIHIEDFEHAMKYKVYSVVQKIHHFVFFSLEKLTIYG